MSKVQDSGMPEESIWNSFFDPPFILQTLGLEEIHGDVVEFGCGYGTFTLVAAARTTGTVHALDLEPEMVSKVKKKCRCAGITNVQTKLRDFVAEGTGLSAESVAVALLFNILHHNEPVTLLEEARRILVPGGTIAVIHWNHDSTTPRGPDMSIRPRPQQCLEWAIAAGLRHRGEDFFDLPPYHYGLLFRKHR